MKLAVPQWRKDCYGHEGRALYLGGLCVGHVIEWQNNKHRPGLHYRGWFMSNDEGDETGWFATEEEAKKSVEDALAKALAQERAP